MISICLKCSEKTSKTIWDSEAKMKSINIFSTAVSASARSWHQPIIIWKVYSWKRKENWFGASRCNGMKGTKLHFKLRAASSRHSTENCDTQFPSCFWHWLAFSSAISIIQVGGNYCNKYWWASVWEWLHWILTDYYTSSCELHRNKWLEARHAAELVLEWFWRSPVCAGKVRWWEEPLWAFPAMADTALFGNGCTCFVFSWRNQKISDYLNCTEIGLVPTGLSLQDTAEHPGMRWLCWGRNQLCIFRGDGTRISYFRWPCGTLQGFNSSPGCWERWRFLSVTLENITKKLLANSSSLQKAFKMKCPEIQTLKHLKVLRC